MTTKWLISAVLVLIVLVGGFFAFKSSAPQQAQAPTDYKNGTFTISGEPVTLVNGVSERPVTPGSSSKTTVRYFGNEATGDLNGDGIPDVAFLVTEDSGGSGTFFYAVGAIQDSSHHYTGTQAVLIGDRIAPQTTEIRANGQLIVNYADRAPGEPMTTQPSIGKSLYLKLDPATMQFGEVVQNFEGEADPSRMTLTMKPWNWVKSVKGGSEILNTHPDRFILTFKDDGTFGATTDCNSVGGSWSEKSGALTFGAMNSTLMYCEASQESEFTGALAGTSAYTFTSKGELILTLKSGGSMTFR